MLECVSCPVCRGAYLGGWYRLYNRWSVKGESETAVMQLILAAFCPRRPLPCSGHATSPTQSPEVRRFSPVLYTSPASQIAEPTMSLW